MDGNDVWMYKGKEGKGEIFKNQSLIDIKNLENKGWRDSPDEAKEVGDYLRKKRVLKSDPRTRMYVEKLKPRKTYGDSR